MKGWIKFAYLDRYSFRNVQNNIDICIIVIVSSSGCVYVVISKLDIFSVCLNRGKMKLLS